ncbi:hypothetical protein HAX54_034995, partial [Datura stramonium]|nr:hypothetical protein [Datura stramonium]
INGFGVFKAFGMNLKKDGMRKMEIEPRRPHRHSQQHDAFPCRCYRSPPDAIVVWREAPASGATTR